MNDRREITQKLLEFLESDSVSHLDNFSEELCLREGLGLDSVDLVGIIMRIEGFYRIRLSHTELERITTVSSLLDLIQARIEEARNLTPPSETKAA